MNTDDTRRRLPAYFATLLAEALRADDVAGLIVVTVAAPGPVRQLHCPFCGRPTRYDVEGTGAMRLVCGACNRGVAHDAAKPRATVYFHLRK